MGRSFTKHLIGFAVVGKVNKGVEDAFGVAGNFIGDVPGRFFAGG